MFDTKQASLSIDSVKKNSPEVGMHKQPNTRRDFPSPTPVILYMADMFLYIPPLD